MRYKMFAERGAREILRYNQLIGPEEQPLPHMVVIIDELAELMMTSPALRWRIVYAASRSSAAPRAST